MIEGSLNILQNNPEAQKVDKMLNELEADIPYREKAERILNRTVEAYLLADDAGKRIIYDNAVEKSRTGEDQVAQLAAARNFLVKIESGELERPTAIDAINIVEEIGDNIQRAPNQNNPENN
ncbi:MAG: hypothetical protein WCP14_03845 [bacterium]